MIRVSLSPLPAFACGIAASNAFSLPTSPCAFSSMILDTNKMEEWMDPQRLFCDTIGSHALICDDSAMKLFVDEQSVECSRLEYLIVRLLLSGRLVTDQRLVQEVYGSTDPALYIEPLGKHIDRLRKKLQPCGLVIPRVAKYGYLLHSMDEQTLVSSPSFEREKRGNPS